MCNIFRSALQNNVQLTKESLKLVTARQRVRNGFNTTSIFLKSNFQVQLGAHNWCGSSTHEYYLLAKYELQSPSGRYWTRSWFLRIRGERYLPPIFADEQSLALKHFNFCFSLLKPCFSGIPAYLGIINAQEHLLTPSERWDRARRTWEVSSKSVSFPGFRSPPPL